VILFRKLVRDLRLPFLIVALLMAAFQCLWIKITERISGDLMPQLLWLAAGRGVSAQEVEETIFGGPGKILKTLLGGESISIFRVTDALSIGYVHPLLMIIMCIWAVGRAASAITGEIDRGTMELLLAQPLARSRLILAHFCIDLISIPILCLSLWGGDWLGLWLIGLKEIGNGGEGVPISATIYAPALWNVAALIFALTGYTMWISSCGRFRGKVLGTAVLVTLLQFLINVVGQLWDTVASLRQFTVFYYYQPQQIILWKPGRITTHDRWSVAWGNLTSGQVYCHVNGVAVLMTVGLVGYGLALLKFCRRDLPAPL
jgi:ABC-2 type transport system permease protein